MTIPSLFQRPRTIRAITTPVSAERMERTVRSANELMQALTDMPDPSDPARQRRCDGKAIVIAANIVLQGSITLGSQHSGLTIRSLNNSLLGVASGGTIFKFGNSVTYVTINGIGLVTTGIAIDLNPSAGLTTVPNYITVDNCTTPNGSLTTFIQCTSGGGGAATHCRVRGNNVSTSTNSVTGAFTNSIFQGNLFRGSSGANFEITAGNGCVLIGNHLDGADITTEDSTGRHVISGNAELATVNAHPSDQVGGNSGAA